MSDPKDWKMPEPYSASVSFLERERGRIFRAMNEREYGSPEYRELYAANQALAWALDPNGFASPADTLCGKGAYVVLPPMPPGAVALHPH